MSYDSIGHKTLLYAKQLVTGLFFFVLWKQRNAFKLNLSTNTGAAVQRAYKIQSLLLKVGQT